MLARVSNVEAFRQWKNWQPLFDGQEEPTVEDLVRFITTDEPTEQMQAGTAFHKALELADEGNHFEMSALGYTFRLADGALELPAIREMRAYGEYGGLTVTGQVDGLHGGLAMDDRKTAVLGPGGYLGGCRWKFYLDLFGADEFRWNVFVIKELEPKVYGVAPPQVLTAYRYPGMHDDCLRLAADYLEFARQHIPEPAVPEVVQKMMAG